VPPGRTGPPIAPHSRTTTARTPQQPCRHLFRNPRAPASTASEHAQAKIGKEEPATTPAPLSVRIGSASGASHTPPNRPHELAADGDQRRTADDPRPLPPRERHRAEYFA